MPPYFLRNENYVFFPRREKSAIMIFRKRILLYALYIFAFFIMSVESLYAGGPAITGPEGFDSGRTLVAGDPVSASGGEFRETWPLLYLGGPMSLDFNLLYAPDLSYKSPWNNGSTQFPSSSTHNGFTTNTILRIVEVRKTEMPGTPVINVFLSDDTVVFIEVSGTYFVIGPIKYQLQKIGDYYYFMDPIKARVIIFRSTSYGWNFPTEEVIRGGEAIYVIDRNNNQLAFQYNNKNNPTLISDGMGRDLILAYGDYGYLSSVSDGYGRVVNFSIEEISCNGSPKNVLASFTDAMGHVTAFSYTPTPVNSNCNLLKSIVNPLGNSHIDQTWKQNAYGREAIDKQSDAYGNMTSFAYSLDAYDNAVTSVVLPNQTQQAFIHQNNRYPKSFVEADASPSAITMNQDFQMTQLTDSLSDTTQFSWHSSTGKLASTTNALGKNLQYSYTLQQQTFTNPVNRDNVTFTFYNLTRMDYPDGTNEQFSHDARGNVLSYTDRAGKIRTYTYNNQGQILTETNPMGGTITYTYNVDATLSTRTDNETGITTYSYDAYKRLKKVNHSDNSYNELIYNLNDQVTSLRNENGNVYQYEYDSNGNLITSTDPKGNQVKYSYDLMDRVSQVTNRLNKNTILAYNNMGKLASVTDSENVITSFGYNPRGWKNSTTLGTLTWHTEYDEEGIVLSSKTPLNNTTTYQSDKLGNIAGITNPLSQAVTFTRDSMNRITDITDALNRKKTITYDGKGLISSVEIPVIGKAEYTRNDLGRISQITDPDGKNWTFQHTNLGRISSSTDPLSRTTGFSYDPRGRLSETTYADASKMTITQDSAGNVTQMQHTGGLNISFSYDNLNQLLTTEGIAFTRDAEGQILSTNNEGNAFDATYDGKGRVKTVLYNNGSFTATYLYDASTGMLKKVMDNLTNSSIEFFYDNDLRVTSITRSNGVNATYTYDNAGRATRIQDGTIIDLQYTFDNAGQITSLDMTAPLNPQTLLTEGVNSLTFDNASQVSSAGYAYDPQGRLTSSPGFVFTWDGASRLTKINNDSLSYNGLGDIITRGDTRFYYNYAIKGHPVVAEKNITTNQFLRYYIWSPDGILLYMIDASNSNKIYFFHFDHAGSTLALTDINKQVTDAYAYNPFGEILGRTGSNPQPFTFCGAWGVRQEGTTGTLYQMRVRYYDAVSGRFLSREPIWPVLSDPRNLNPYQYALNNPILYSDPNGTFVAAAQIVAAIARKVINEFCFGGGELGSGELQPHQRGDYILEQILQERRMLERFIDNNWGNPERASLVERAMSQLRTPWIGNSGFVEYYDFLGRARSRNNSSSTNSSRFIDLRTSQGNMTSHIGYRSSSQKSTLAIQSRHAREMAILDAGSRFARELAEEVDEERDWLAYRPDNLHNLFPSESFRFSVMNEAWRDNVSAWIAQNPSSGYTLQSAAFQYLLRGAFTLDITSAILMNR